MPLPKNNLLFGFEPKLTDEQRIYVNSIFDKRLTIVNAKSGSGKTTLAVACAKLLKKDLLYIFSPCEEDKLGFTPGEIEDKEAKYIQPLMDALYEIEEDPKRVVFREDNIENLKKGNVWVYPKSHVFARGTNIKNKTVIIDEYQNFTISEFKKITTRIHDDCSVIVIGHGGQIDLKDPKKSCYSRVLEHFKDKPWANICHLSKNFRGELSQWADEL